MKPRNQILRGNYDTVTASPNLKSKPTAPNPSTRKLKSSKENAPPTPTSDLNSTASSPAAKTKSPLPPRPPLKRKLSVESAASEICAAPTGSLDSGVNVIVRVRPPNKEDKDGGNVVQKLQKDSLTIAGQTFSFDSIADIHSKQARIPLNNHLSSRLESLMDGILPTEEFMEEELLSLTHKHKRDVLLEEIQDLRTQLQSYIDSSAKLSKRQTRLLQLVTSCEPCATPALSTNQDSYENANERFQQERIQWSEAESKWISLVEELRIEVQRQKQELEDMNKKCSEEIEEAMLMAMEGQARMVEQYIDLEEKHMQLLVRHRKIQDGIDDVKKAAAKVGLRGAESKLINALAAELSIFKVEREKERRYLRDEIKGLRAQLRDTAEAVQAAGELLVRLKEAEKAMTAAERRAIMAEQETEDAYTEIEKLRFLLAAPHMPKEKFASNRAREAVSISNVERSLHHLMVV